MYCRSFMMSYIYLILAIAAALRTILASTIPNQTSFTNYTKTSSFEPALMTGCPFDCYRKVERISTLTWLQKSVTATITAETVVLVVNQLYNTTRTTTITNTELDLKKYTPPSNTNSAGTKTTSVVVTSSGTVLTQPIAFPTKFYSDYPSSYTLCGTLPTTVSGAATCLRYPCADRDQTSIFGNGQRVFTFPSHPPIPRPSGTTQTLGFDLKGFTYDPVWMWESDYQADVQRLMPELGVWKCDFDILQRPAEVKETAFYMTATSVSTEIAEGIHVPHPSIAVYTGTQSPSVDSSPRVSGIEATSSHISRPSAAAAVRTMSTSSSVSLVSIQAPTPVTEITGSTGRISRVNAEASNVFDSARSEPVSSSLSLAMTTYQPIQASTKNMFTTGVSTTAVSIQSVIGLTPNEGEMESSATSSHLVVLTSDNAQGSPVITAITLAETHTPDVEAKLFVLDSHTISANSDSQYLLAGQTLIPGSPITLGSGPAATPILLHTARSQTFIVEGSSSLILPANTFNPPLPSLVIGLQTVTANSEHKYVVESHTLAPGLPITLGSGTAATPVMVQTSESDTILIVGSSTSTLPVATAAAASQYLQALTVASQVITVNSDNQYVLGSQTLAPGSPITLGSGSAATPVLLQTSDSETVLVVGSSTSILRAAATTTAVSNRPQPLTIGSQVITANSESQYVVGSQTLIPVALASSTTQSAAGSSTQGLGGAIMNGLAAGPSASGSGDDNNSSARPLSHSGAAAARQWGEANLWRTILIIEIMFLMGAWVNW